MLARLNSAAGGVVEYLEKGQKRGRKYTRDEIDERMVLEGNLTIAEAAIESIRTVQSGATRYLHITLGFAERFTRSEICGPGEINLQRMHEATESYRDLLMAAYDRDEYCWYAEAHIPKVTHDIHATTGEAYERLPHVHIVLPRRNLVAGTYLDPASHGVSQTRSLQAIQEAVNARFGLASPVDHRRDLHIEPLARHAIRNEVGIKQIRQSLELAVANGSARSFEQLLDLAKAHGVVTVRKGRDGDYLNVKPAWAERGINLKTFTRQDFAQQAGAARAAPPGAMPSEFEQPLQEWVQRRSLEVRYLANASHAVRKRYTAMAPDERQAWLGAQRQASRERLVEAQEPGVAPSIRIKKGADQVLPDRQQLAAVAELQRANMHAAVRGRPPRTLTDLPRLGDAPRLGESRIAPGAAAAKVPLRKAGAVLERAADLPAPTADLRLRRLTVAGTLARLRAPVEIDPEVLKRDTSPTLLLALAAKRYGLQLQEYEVASSRDGSPRIRHLDRHYNLGDLLTKQLGRPWEEAREVLTQAYHQTLADTLPPPDAALWREFGVWQGRARAQAAAARSDARAKTAARIRMAREIYREQQDATARMPKAERTTARAQQRAAAVLEIVAARAERGSSLADVQQVPRAARFRVFLTERANQGDLAALGELRRLAPPEPAVEDLVTGKISRICFGMPTYRVDHHGAVLYSVDGNALVKDSRQGVTVIKAHHASYQMALLVAIRRYGTALTITGDKAFMEGMQRAVRDMDSELKAHGIKVSLRDGNAPERAVQALPVRAVPAFPAQRPSAPKRNDGPSR